MKYSEVPETEQWGVSLVKELLGAKFGQTFDLPFNQQELDDLLDFACTS